MTCNRADPCLAKRTSGVVCDQVRSPISEPLLQQPRDASFVPNPRPHPELPPVRILLDQISEPESLDLDTAILVCADRIILQAGVGLRGKHTNFMASLGH